jgi:DNA-binding response OmpR family regulator
VKKILLIDPDRDYVRFVAQLLEGEGYSISSAFSGADGMALAGHQTDLIILEVNLPDMDGWEVARRLMHDKDTSHIPILIVSAKSSELEEVIGLELGAVDVIRKPIAPASFSARVRAALRHADAQWRGRLNNNTVIRIANLIIDVPNFSVRAGDTDILLAKKEFDLFVCLVQHRDHVVTRQILLDTVWGKDSRVYARTLDVHIRKIREKLGKYGTFIITINRVGYKFSTPGNLQSVERVTGHAAASHGHS